MPNSTTDTEVNELIINTLTKAQYDELVANNQIEPNQLYLTKDEEYCTIFEVIYNTTTYASITTAVSAKQQLICNYNNYQYVYAGNDNTNHYFTCAINDEIKYVKVTNANIWSNGSVSKASQDGDGNVISSTYLKLSGGTLTGAVNTANNTLNKIGDDAYIGDVNLAGCIGIKGQNGATGIVFKPYSGSTDIKMTSNGSGTLTVTGTISSTFSGDLTGTASKATADADGNEISTTYIKAHQSIKTLKTDNTSAQTASSSEAISGSGTINLHKISKSGSYDDLLNKPTIPTVNNSTITIQKNGTNVDSFTTNASSNKSINITLAKGDVGLGNVDNTSDLSKPISTATQTALDGKENTISDLSKIRSGANSFYVKGTQTASTNAFTGVLNAVSELYEGLTIDYWLPFAGTSTAATLNLTLAGGTTTGAVNCYYSGTTRLTTHLSANCVGRLIYQTVTISGTNYTGWWLLKAYYSDTNTNTHERSLDQNYRAYAGMKIPNYALVMKGLNSRLYPMVDSYSTATNKIVTTVGLRPDKIWMFAGNATINAGAVMTDKQLYRDYPSTAGNSYFNGTMPTYCDIYLCGDYNEDTNLFYLATTDASGNASVTDFYRFVPYNTEPTYSDYFITGRYYIFLGSSYSTANAFQLMDQHELYYYDGTNLIRAVDKPKYAATFVDWSE